MNIHTLWKQNSLRFLGIALMASILLSLGLVACNANSASYTGKTYIVTIKASSAGAYAFDQSNFVNQQNLTIILNDTITIDNPTTQTFTFGTTPAGGPPDGAQVGANGKSSFQFTRSGTWTIKSKEHPELAMTIVVQ